MRNYTGFYLRNAINNDIQRIIIDKCTLRIVILSYIQSSADHDRNKPEF